MKTAYIWMVWVAFDGREDYFNVIATDEEHARRTGQYMIDNEIFVPGDAVITKVFTFREEAA